LFIIILFKFIGKHLASLGFCWRNSSGSLRPSISLSTPEMKLKLKLKLKLKRESDCSDRCSNASYADRRFVFCAHYCAPGASAFFPWLFFFFFFIKKIDKKDCDGPHTCKKAARFSRDDGSLMGLGVLFASSTLTFFINDHGPLNLLVHHLYTFVYTVNL